MRQVLFLVTLLGAPSAWAGDLSTNQLSVGADKVLRGHFTEQHHVISGSAPIRSEGHFVAAPAYGLIWAVEKPFPTSTIITSNNAVQDFGGIKMKLPVKNLQALYVMISRALAGDWSALEKDYVISRSTDGRHWQMQLTPHKTKNTKLPYTAIKAEGGDFIEHIGLSRANGNAYTIDFIETTLSALPLSDTEAKSFKGL
jgi:hypothetical protein